jgi:cell wall-associated NlpC family hydrolase
MTYFVITAVAPIRAEPSHKSEMISQLLFGELADGLEEKGDFIKIRGRYDHYEGWCQRKQLAQLSGSDYLFEPKYVEHLSERVEVNGISLILSPGSICPLNDKSEPINIGAYSVQYFLTSANSQINPANGVRIVEIAKQFLGTPYQWGGKSIYGMDCSGLAQTAYKLAGIFLPRDSGPQSNEGTIVNLLQEAKPGDLAFFDNEEGRIVHVGILTGTDSILHASASVRIDPIDNYGIVHAQEGDRTHRLRTIKRFFREEI